MPDRPRSDHVVLVGDIGGTFVRFALARNGVLLNEPARIERARWPDLAGACRSYLVDHGGGLRIDGASIAAAGRVQHGRIAMTNADWSVDPAVLSDALGLRASNVAVLNDFAALAWALQGLGDDEWLSLPGGAAARSGGSPPMRGPGGHRVVLGPGTGLGVAAMLDLPEGGRPLSSEGGHASAAAQTAFEQAAVDFAARRFGRASWERVLSGPGLALLHEVARREAGLPGDGGDAADTLEACRRGDPAAVRATRAFVEWLGAFAGDLALLYDATGGVVIAGGVLPRIASVMPLDGLRDRFEAKGRFAPWLAGVPLVLLNAPFAALRGAALAYRG